MKGQQQIVSAVLLTGILVTIVGSVYLWGIPLIEKNKAVNTLHNAEDFMERLNNKIKFIANNGGQDTITFNLPGTIVFDSTKDPKTIYVVLRTKGSIYSSGGKIPLSRNITKNTGNWVSTDPESIYVMSNKTSEDNYINTYGLFFRSLKKRNGDKYLINLTGSTTSAGTDHDIVIENRGSERNGKTISTAIYINIL